MTFHEKLLRIQSARLKAFKNQTGSSRGGRPYHYADLDSVLDVALPALTAQGLLLVQRVEPNSVNEGGMVMNDRLVTEIIDAETGEKARSAVSLDNASDWHAYGSAMTYARRYSLCAMLNIAGESDDDAHSTMPPSQSARSSSSGAPRQPNGNGNNTRQPGEDVPECPDCGNIGMRSKYKNRDGTEFYCGKCKQSY